MRWGGTMAVGVAILVGPSSAGAATVIGQTFNPDSGNLCSDGFTRLQGTSPNGQYAAPSEGVITSWSYQAGGDPPRVRFKAAHPEGGNSFTIVGEGDLQTPTPNQLNTYAVRIPVRPDDVIGLYLADTGFCTIDVSGYQENIRFGDFTPGTMASFDADLPNTHQLDVSALLEPDCDSDGFGDETQDPDLSACRARTLSLDASKNKVKKGKKVTLSGEVVDGPQNTSGCTANQAVELQRKKPSQTIFATVEELQTTGSGNFSTKQRVKRTLEYRALVTESADCQSVISNTEKVKVKKKKKKRKKKK